MIIIIIKREKTKRLKLIKIRMETLILMIPWHENEKQWKFEIIAKQNM